MGLSCIHRDNATVLAFLNASLLRATRVAHDVIHLILLRPTAVCASHLLARHKRLHGVFFAAYNPTRLQFVMYTLIDLCARAVVGRNYQCAFRRLGILVCNGRDAFLMALYLMNTTLPVEILDCGSNLTVSQLLDSLLQLRVALPHNLIQLHRAHSRFLKLRKGAACFDGLMLARVAY